MAQSELEVLTVSVDGLTTEIQALRGEMVELHDYGHESRRLIRRLNRIIAGVVLLALAVGVVAVIAIRGASEARTAARAAQRNAVNAYDACLTANGARKTTRDLWTFILDLPSVQTLSPQERQARDTLAAALRTRVATSYADQDCSKLVPPH